MENQNTIIDYNFVQKWSPRYDELGIGEKYIAGYERIMKQVKQELSQGALQEATFRDMLQWKYTGLTRILKWHPFEYFSNGIQQALHATEEEKMIILVDLDGIKVALASTILHFIYPTGYSIMDRRVAETLNEFGYLKAKTPHPKNYHRFQKIMADLVRQTGCTLREIDKALFAYDKIMIERIKKNCR